MGQTNFRDGTLVSGERNRRGVDPEIPRCRHRTGVYQTSDLSSPSDRATVLTTGLVTSVYQKDRKVPELAMCRVSFYIEVGSQQRRELYLWKYAGGGGLPAPNMT